MKKNKLRFALVGCGSITNKHISALQGIEDAEIVCVCVTLMRMRHGR